MGSLHQGNTIFLTEQEAERIRSTVRHGVKRCSEVEGNVREARDFRGSISEATGASLMADMARSSFLGKHGQEETIPALAVGQFYAPCSISHRELELMKLADLKLHTHHRGRRLIVRCASPVVTLAARSWTMVKDGVEAEPGPGDEIERLEICLHKTRHFEDLLQSASVIVIKEPYFTLTDEEHAATIRVDHPSDVIVYRDEVGNIDLTSDEELGANLDDTEAQAAKAVELAKSCKDKGNAALGEQDLALAHAHYTEGLKVAQRHLTSEANADLAQDLFRNRAHVNLLLNQFDDARADAQASLLKKDDDRSKELDGKAFFRAGSAAYSLGEYREAKSYFDRRLELAPSNKETLAYLRMIQRRLEEQENGAYDFKKIRAGLSRARPRADAASFLGNTRVSESPGRGRGLFATQDISSGEIVICEKAFCVVWSHEKEALAAMTYDVRDDRIRVSPVGLARSIVQKLLNNPSRIREVLNLYGDYQGDAKAAHMTDDGPVVDTFRIHDIMSRNAFGLGSQYGVEEGARNASTGLWIWAAYVNHSCIPNVRKECIGDLMVLRATRSISAGQEIFHSYDESSDYDVRQEALVDTWGFECSCSLCAVERAEDGAVRQKRRELAEEADKFVEIEHWAKAKRLTIVKAQRLARAIENTYDSKTYQDLPRLATRRIQEWLAQATPGR